MNTLPQPHLEPMLSGRGDTYRVTDDYVVKLPDCRAYLRVRAGFITNGANIPRFLWRIVGNPFDPDTMAPVVAHDALYAAEVLCRERCDLEFRLLMERNGKEAQRKARMFYLAVRWFGGFVWSRHTRRSIEHARRLVQLEEV